MENKSNQGFLEKVLHLSGNYTDIKTEVIAGITTLMAMACILAVNPNISSATRMDRDVVFIVAVLASLVATLLMIIFTNYPSVLVPGMGLNAYFVYTVVLQMDYTWQMALVTVSTGDPISIVLSPTNVREAIFNVIPMNLKHAASAGTGSSITFIGLQNAKIMVESVALVSVLLFKGSLDAGISSPVRITILPALIGVLITGTLAVKNIKRNVLWNILVTRILGTIYEVTGLYQSNAELGMFNVFPDLSSGFDIQSMALTFLRMDFSDILSLNFVTIMFVFLFVDMFGILGTLIGMASKADMLGRDGKFPKIRGAPLSDAVGTSLGAAFGTSTTATFVESASGVTEGGKTGLTSVVAAILSGLSLLLSPIFLAISPSATAPAPVIVDFLMISSILKIDFNDSTEAIPSCIATIAMSSMYSISEGVAMGVISCMVIDITTGHAKEKKINLLMYILATLFILKYVLI